MQLKMLNRIATVKDDGTVVVDVPSSLESATAGGTEDAYTEVLVDDSLDGADIPYRPPMQIVILIVGTRGDVQPFVAIGKRLQVSHSRNLLSIQFSLSIQLSFVLLAAE
jgi:sterol 3beta-glucosyltransferase